MAWREHHPMPYQSKLKEKFLGPFSLGETAWLGMGMYLSYQLAQVVPPIGSEPFLSRLHQLIPLAITFILAFGKHKGTGLTIGKYLMVMIKIRVRRRVFLYRKMNIQKGGDR